MAQPLDPPALALIASDAAPIPLDLSTVPSTPRGPAARLQGAAREAWARACALRAEWLDQRGVDPVLLICAVDCTIGRGIVERTLGPAVPSAVSGPVVFAVEWPEIESALGADAAKALAKQLEAVKAMPGEMVLLFAVNGRGVDLRVVRAPIEQPAEQPPVGALQPPASA